MADLRPYRLTVLLEPSSTADARHTVADTVRAWVTAREGEIREITATEVRSLAYGIHQAQKAAGVQAFFTAPPAGVADLLGQLRQHAHVLRARLFVGEIPGGQRLASLPAPRAGGAAAPQKPAKTKVPFEKLGEKIDEILKKEVL